jgi:hypothetical protein
MPRGVYPRTNRHVDNRFWPKVHETDFCWWWEGARNHLGYGRFWLRGNRWTLAHRYAFERLTHREIPDTLTLDHLCRNPSCVNPVHLQPVTQRENTMRGDTIPARNAAKTHCPKGHSYAEHAYYRPDRPGKFCNECRRERDRLRGTRPKAAVR